MSFNISNFKNNFKYGGARSNLFEMQMGYPPGLNAGDIGVNLGAFSTSLRFLCNSASIPSSSVDAVTIPYQGREVYSVGTKTFDPFTITIINDEDFYLRKTFEFWIGAMNGHKTNTKNRGLNSSPSSYQVDAEVKQFAQTSSDGQTPTVIRAYKFINMFPISLSAIDLSWNSNAIEEFSVSFRYDYWKVGDAD
jgi:hypothetical protein